MKIVAGVGKNKKVIEAIENVNFEVFKWNLRKNWLNIF